MRAFWLDDTGLSYTIGFEHLDDKKWKEVELNEAEWASKAVTVRYPLCTGWLWDRSSKSRGKRCVDVLLINLGCLFCFTVQAIRRLRSPQTHSSHKSLVSNDKFHMAALGAAACPTMTLVSRARYRAMAAMTHIPRTEAEAFRSTAQDVENRTFPFQ
jgi:hypothetical protein